MFFQATNFDSDLSEWNTSKVTYINYMFCNAENFNSNLHKWDLSKVNYMNDIFDGATKCIKNRQNFNGVFKNKVIGIHQIW
jgi:surface protein